jgi:hypothetical protein
MEYNLHLPTLSHWEYGNPWSGERGRARFQIKVAEGQMLAEVWRGPMARAFVEPEMTQTFPVSEEGIEVMRDWLMESAARLNDGETTA